MTTNYVMTMTQLCDKLTTTKIMQKINNAINQQPIEVMQETNNTTNQQCEKSKHDKLAASITQQIYNTNNNTCNTKEQHKKNNTK